MSTRVKLNGYSCKGSFEFDPAYPADTRAGLRERTGYLRQWLKRNVGAWNAPHEVEDFVVEHVFVGRTGVETWVIVS